MALLCVYLNGFGQYKNAPPKIGFKVPDISFQTINDTGAKQKLSDFKGKLVILDFWATWCTSCIGHFPQMDSLQKKYKNVLQVVLVNSIKGSGDSMEKVRSFIRFYTSRYKNSFSPLVVAADTLAYRLFPHTYLPHFVWIDQEGRLIAVTAPSMVTEEIIKDILETEGLLKTKDKTTNN